jgi:putative oxidoreductase
LRYSSGTGTLVLDGKGFVFCRGRPAKETNMHRFFPAFVRGGGAFGLLLVRLVVGAAFVLHGWPKIHDPLHWMDQAPSPPPSALQALAAVSEFGGGIALILGLLTPLAALAIAGTMIGALAMVHLPQGHSFVDPFGPSFELPAVYLATMIMLLLVGPGVLSADACLFGRKTPSTGSAPS